MARIVVVDDEPELLALTVSVLESDGHDVAGVLPSGEGFKDIHADPPDLLVIDFGTLGIESGAELLEILREPSALTGVPVVLCSSDPRFVVDQILAEANDPTIRVVYKPFNIGDLVAVVKGALTPPLTASIPA